MIGVIHSTTRTHTHAHAQCHAHVASNTTSLFVHSVCVVNVIKVTVVRWNAVGGIDFGAFSRLNCAPAETLVQIFSAGGITNIIETLS